MGYFSFVDYSVHCFCLEEEKNDADFSRQLANDATIYVNDAFGTAHRAHASTAGVAKLAKHRVAGRLMEKELIFLQGAVEKPERPFAAIIGGAKLSTKMPVLKSLVQKCDAIFIGGGMMFTFLKALGLNIGSSMVHSTLCNAVLLFVVSINVLTIPNW